MFLATTLISRNGHNMSYSLKIQNGDLSIGTGRALDTVSGAFKLGQDLELWVLERLGTDPSTPQYGTSLDGGVLNGQAIPSFIGQMATQVNVNAIQSQINAMLLTYQSLQVAKQQADIAVYGQSTLTPDEILQEITSIQALAVQDQVIVRVTITALSGLQQQLTIPVAV